MRIGDFHAWLGDERRRPLVMGILNVTPDSFSDGGRFAGVDAARVQAEQMAAAGADLIDVGGESTRPGAQRVSADEQISRILPVIRAIAPRLPVVVSVDTTRSEVASAAIDAGASMVNDISAGAEDPAMLPLVAARQAAIVLMHMQGEPATMQRAPHYADVVGEVTSFLAGRVKAAEAAGVIPRRVLVDPGIGFGKSVDHNLTLVRDLRMIARIGRPVVVGTSRKGFIGHLTGETEPCERLMGTAASVAWSVANGAGIVRVHDVEAMVKVLRVIRAIQLGHAD